MPKKTIKKTRQRLISAGLKFFAERGYARATVRDICEYAKGNMASINYYFSDKKEFYSAVSSYAHSLRLGQYQEIEEASRGRSPWEILELYVDTLLGNAYNSESFLAAWFCFREYLSDDIAREQGTGRGRHKKSKPTEEVEETSLHEELEKTRLKKQEELHIKTIELMRELLQEAATPKNLALLHYTYVSLSLFLLLESRFGKECPNDIKLLPNVQRNELKEYIVGILRATVAKMREENPAISK